MAFAAIFAVVGLLLGYFVRDFTWFARSGALVVAVGLVLLSRAGVIGNDILVHVGSAQTSVSFLDPEHYRRLGEPVPEYVLEDLRTRAAVGFWGPLISGLGTVIWGFGDLLNKVAGFAA